MRLVHSIRNHTSESMALIIEPWGHGLELAPNKVLDVEMLEIGEEDRIDLVIKPGIISLFPIGDIIAIKDGETVLATLTF